MQHVNYYIATELNVLFYRLNALYLCLNDRVIRLLCNNENGIYICEFV